MRRRFNTTSSFLDILFNILLGFFVLLVLTITLVNPPTKKGDIELKAEFIITMTWPDKSLDDVDLLVLTPMSKRPIFFANRDVKGASLDRDDRGLKSDTLRMSDGTVHRVYENWEHVAIRKMVPGEYIVNALMYHKVDKRSTPVSIKVEKLNPYRLVYAGKLRLRGDRDEKTAVRFRINKKGQIISRSRIPRRLSTMMGRR
jgi:hypothetical protein